MSIDGKLTESLLSIWLPVHIANRMLWSRIQVYPGFNTSCDFEYQFSGIKKDSFGLWRNITQIDDNVVPFMKSVYHADSYIFDIHGCDAATRKHPVDWSRCHRGEF